MRVAVLGGGYVGLVTAACLAETGNDVVCADLDGAKVDGLRANRIPIYEPGLDALVRENQAQGRLHFTTDLEAAVEHGKVVIIAVGTPHEQSGAADLSQVLSAARTIGDHLNEPKIVVTKSTVPVGTSERVREEIRSRSDHPFFMASNPEFLKQGGAVDDFMKPDRVVVGVDSDEARDAMEELYAPYLRTGNPLLVMDIASAELTKYAANAMLASRISFMNQVAELCERVGADVELVRRGMATDRRIGPAFLFPGPGYGGSCFPKDVKALVSSARGVGMDPVLFEAVEAANEHQKTVLLRKVCSALGRLDGLTVAVWGLAFKAGTDDIRESPAIPLIHGLLERGARVVAHDPHAEDATRRMFGDRIQLTAEPYCAAKGASALVVVTEWLQYRTPDFDRIRDAMARPLIIDGRNLWDPARMKKAGFEYHGIGRVAP
ncbi:MAG TPA: UDP-glucose/GDP-mannose dehydrogenase family protein [Gemmatimonadales bacterium]|nr:UDP-glucose/GDP-mannose dehydrogenase family protein [Gemmatimonadales bacterium]